MNEQNYKNASLKFFAILVAVVLIVCTLGYFHLKGSAVSTPKVGGGFVTALCDTNGNSGSTTTPTYITTATASTTLTCYTASAASIDMNLYVIASSSSSGIQWEYAFSDNNKDWYYENGVNMPTNILAQNGATPLLHTWVPGIAGTSTRNITITPTASKYVRVEIDATGASSSVYTQFILKNIITN